jgi:hypothetical protein
MPARLSSVPRLALFALLLPILAACGPRTNEFAPACPNPTFLRDLSDLVRYRPGSGGRDVTDLIVRARLAALNGKCSDLTASVLETQIQVTLELFRGPGLVGNKIEVPIFLAVVENGEIVNKQIFPVIFEFPSNLDRATITTPPVALGLPVSPEKSGAAYGIIVGFQLTPEELAVNRRRGF